ncbi:MAG TPA: hypothetical protein VIJ82_16385 [Streptosporangiaceae bacterium]
MLEDSVDTLDCNQVALNHVRHPEPTYPETVIITPMEGAWQIRVLGQASHRSTDLAHPVLIF